MTSKTSIERLTIAAAFVLPLLAFGCGSDHPAALERTSVSAATAVAGSATLPATRAVAGTVVSTNASPLSSRVVGDVLRVLVSEGDRVRAGQLLVEIDARDGRAQAGAARASSAENEQAIAAAQANATLAEATFRRYSALHERHSVSDQEFDDVKMRHDAARAGLARVQAKRGEVTAMTARAQAHLDDSSIRAPFDGVVTRRFVDPGAQAAPGMPLLSVEDPRSLRVEASVPESVRIAAGDAITLLAGEQKIDGRVANVQPGVNATSRSALVKISLASTAGLRPGSYVRVLLPAGERTALTVPASAIVRHGALTSVFVVGSDGVARMRIVTLGEGEEVLSGLAQGERVVIEPAKVRDGVKVV